ncbi:nuclease [Exiguobacterium sp. SH3S2]|uniref:3'-5' exonuclease n=1 Tax=unclassified Exiguobacterium TaxID=2644629 RepID=UPI0010399568|nr:MULTISPECIES: 3'-5' exonuclease [unclassified Exiguobacterium]TCI48964.1 nuclease [Exiguobacterium sp. SH3S3]TCI63828.1 nuclease [Exiguobacterium sp. SH3S2]TCI64945.1 nuclease [Exiguobacterium sp. SH3S1]
MALSVPETIRTSATSGERLVFRTLKHYLPDDYIVYFEPSILGRRPDFVIIGPDLGLLVLEVKDYTRNTLFQLTNDEWIITPTDGKQQKIKSPFVQARENMFHIVDVLKRDQNLIQAEGKYTSSLKFPYGSGVVFTRLNQDECIRHGLYNVIDPSFSFTRDEINPDDDDFSETVLIEKILNMFTVPYRLRTPLTHDDIDAIRYHLFPEVRISAEFKKPAQYQDQLLLSLHNIRAMDLHQENLAKQLGDQNRLIRGVAGSGKTLILASRAKLLSRQHPDWNILILCYNISLARFIEQMVNQMMLEPDDLFDFDPEKRRDHHVQIRNFHAWLKHDLKFSEQSLPHVIEKLRKNETILPMYDAILIDEGQDFEPEWLELASELLNPETKSLLLVEDRAQSIYKRKRSYAQDTGLDFRGRSKILSINYRNTAQIVKFAWDFYQSQSKLKNKVVSKELDGEIIAPQSTRRRGVEPAIVKCDNFFIEADIVARQIKKLHVEKQIPYSEMIILYRVQKLSTMYYVDVLSRALNKQQIGYYWITENSESKRNFSKDDQLVKISTIDSSKGLDFQAVFIVNVDNMPFKYESDVEREVALLYIGMTRAKEFLFLSYSGQSAFTQYLESLKTEVKSRLLRKDS